MTKLNLNFGKSVNVTIGIFSFLLALVCLYFAFSILGERLLKDQLAQRLKNLGVESEWVYMKWSGRGICAFSVRVKMPKKGIYTEIDHLCTRLSLDNKWPFFKANDILIHQPQVWVHQGKSALPNHVNKPPVLSPWDRAETLVRELGRVQQHFNQSWRELISELEVIEGHQISITEGIIRLDRKLFSALPFPMRNQSQSYLKLLFNADLHHLGGRIAFVPPRLTYLLIKDQSSSIKLSFSHESITLLEPIDIQFNGMHFKFDRNSNLVILPRQQHLHTSFFLSSLSSPSPKASSSLEGFQLHFSSIFLDKKPNVTSHYSRQTESKIQHKVKIKAKSNIDHPRRTYQANQPQLEITLTSSHSDKYAVTSPLETGIKVEHLSLNTVLSHLSKLAEYFNHQELKKLIRRISTYIPFGKLNGRFKLRNKTFDFDYQLLHPQFNFFSLPRLSWPKLQMKGQIRKTSSSSVNHNVQLPINSLTEWLKGSWQVKPLSLTIHNQKNNSLKIFAHSRFQLDQSKTVSLITLNQGDIDLETDPIACSQLYSFVPSTLTGPILSAELVGKLNPKISMSYRPLEVSSKKSKDPITLTVKGFLRRCRFEGLRLDIEGHSTLKKQGKKLKIKGVEWLNKGFTFEINPAFTNGKKVTVGPETKGFVPLNELPEYVGGAMYLTEETGFWRGGAFSLNLLKKALNTNVKEGRFVYGGSTITQQLVKNLFLHREKTLTRKFREALISARIIDAVSKHRVLELYLNMIEFGPQVYGIQAAAKYYFQKDARLLTPEEAVFLAMLKVSPSRGARWKRRGSSPKFTWWKNRMVQIFDRLVKEGLITSQRAKGATPFILNWKNGVYQGSTVLN